MYCVKMRFHTARQIGGLPKLFYRWYAHLHVPVKHEEYKQVTVLFTVMLRSFFEIVFSDQSFCIPHCTDPSC